MNMSLHNIVWIAFNIQPEQLVAPDWMKEPRFDITAKVKTTVPIVIVDHAERVPTAN